MRNWAFQLLEQYYPSMREQGASVMTEATDKDIESGVNLQNLLSLTHGSPTFYRLLEEAAKLHNRKSHDYASNENPYGNYEFAGQVATMFSYSPSDAGFIGRLAEKIYRIKNLEGSGKAAKNEDIEETENDIFVITALWISNRRDRRKLSAEANDAKGVRDTPSGPGR